MEKVKNSIPYLIDIDDTPLIDLNWSEEQHKEFQSCCAKLLKDGFRQLFDRELTQQDIYSAIKHHYDRTNKS